MSAYHCYTPQFEQCPNCQCCEEHRGKTLVVTGRRYFRVEDDGTRVELTEEQYRNRFRGETK